MDFSFGSFFSDTTAGWVSPNTTNTWQSTIEAAPESQMMPAKVLKYVHMTHDSLLRLVKM